MSLITLTDRITAAIWSISIADALAMPVHWFYNPQDITKKFGVIRDYKEAGLTHPSSIMGLANTGGQGNYFDNILPFHFISSYSIQLQSLQS